MASFTSSMFFFIVLWITVTVVTVSSAPIPSDQQDIADFSNSQKDKLGQHNVFLPFRQVPERLMESFTSEELDYLPPESDINYSFLDKGLPTVPISEYRKLAGF